MIVKTPISQMGAPAVAKGGGQARGGGRGEGGERRGVRWRSTLESTAPEKEIKVKRKRGPELEQSAEGFSMVVVKIIFVGVVVDFGVQPTYHTCYLIHGNDIKSEAPSRLRQSNQKIGRFVDKPRVADPITKSW